MAELLRFSTAGMDPRRRVEYWNSLTGSTLTRLSADPLNPEDFSGQLTCTHVGTVQLAELYSDPAIVRHLRHHISHSSEQQYFLCLQLDGVSVNRQQGREAVLHYGDFTLFDSSRPYEVRFEQPNRMLVLCIPEDELSRRMANPESMLGAAMSGQSGMTGLLSSFLRNFWQQRCSGDDAFLSPRFAGAVLDLVATAYASVPEAIPSCSSLTIARREQVRSYIEAHLCDPGLTPMRVAAALRVSPRYLHHLFADEEETIARYILRRRLEECACAISDASQRGRTVTEIAFKHGFNDASHFGRVFRAHYGMTPREYRRRHLA